jgi:hypothetical protein
VHSRRLLILLATLLVLAIPAASVLLRSSQPTSAQTTQQSQITITPNSFAEGSLTSLKVTGTGFDPGSEVDLEAFVATDDLSNPTADEKGKVTAASNGSIEDDTFPVPANISPATYFITAIEPTGGNANFASNTFTVTSDSTTPTDTPTLTGSITPTGTPTSTDTPTPTVTGTPPTATATPTATTILTPTVTNTPISIVPPPPPPPGGNPTPTPTATATPLPTDTPTPSPTPTDTPISPTLEFSVVATKIGYGSSDPSRMLHRASLKHVKLGSKIKLLLYTAVSGIVGPLPITLGFRVTQGGPTVYLEKVDETLTPADDGKTLSWFQFFTPTTKGPYRFHGTLFVGAHHTHKFVDFTAVKA